MAGFKAYNRFRQAHKELINESLGNGNNIRQIQWLEGIAVGSQSFVDTIKDKLGIRAKGRKTFKTDEGFQFEELGTYIADYDIKNDDTGHENCY